MSVNYLQVAPRVPENRVKIQRLTLSGNDVCGCDLLVQLTALRSWNHLSLDIHGTQSTETLKKKLKTYLFCNSYVQLQSPYTYMF